MTKNSTPAVRRAKIAAGLRRMRAKQENFAVHMGYSSAQNMLTKILRNDLSKKHLAFIRKESEPHFYPVFHNDPDGYWFSIYRLDGDDTPALPKSMTYGTMKEAREVADAYIYEYERVIR